MLNAVVNGLVGMFNGIHAAKAGAITEMSPVARAYAQYKKNILGMSSVRGADNFPAGRSCRIDQAFKLQSCQYIGMSPIPVLLELPGVQHIVTGCQDN